MRIDRYDIDVKMVVMIFALIVLALAFAIFVNLWEVWCKMTKAFAGDQDRGSTGTRGGSLKEAGQ